MDQFISLFPYAFLLFVAVFFWLQLKGEEKRKTAIKDLCSRTGFTFEAEKQPSSEAGWFSFPLFSRGRSQKASNIGVQKLGRFNFVFFDYRYSTGGGKSRQTHKAFVVAKYGACTLPDFTLWPEDFFSKIAQAVGYQDIDLAHDPEFSKLFVLRGQDQDRIRQIFHLSVTRNLIQHPACQLEGNTNGVIWYSSQRPKVEDIPATLDKARSILELFI